MGNPILLVTNAGHGETPDCPEAEFEVGEVVIYRGERDCVVAAIVPPGFPPEYALADAQGKARPLMISECSRFPRYIVGRQNDRRPYLAFAAQLKSQGEAPATITWQE